MPPERLRVRQIVGASRSDTSRSLSTEAKSPVFISISTQHGYRGRWAFATSLRRHRLQRSPAKTGWDCRFQFSVRIESQNTLALHAVFCGHLCDFYHARNAPLQSMNPARTFGSISRPPLACPLGIWPGPDSGHVPCCRILFAGVRRHRPVLRQTPSRQ